jgi:hypothetical protein
MTRHTYAALAIVAVVLGGSGVATLDALDNHEMLITFNQPVALPGVTLRAGTYVFEMPNFDQRQVVRVLSRDRGIVYLTALTVGVKRPPTLKPNQAITFAESGRNEPPRVSVWWPMSQSTGRQFFY